MNSNPSDIAEEVDLHYELRASRRGSPSVTHKGYFEFELPGEGEFEMLAVPNDRPPDGEVMVTTLESGRATPFNGSMTDVHSPTSPAVPAGLALDFLF